jgi:hypothetical protein
MCGEPMPEGETMFKFHGFSGPCPAPPLPRPAAINWQTSYERAIARIVALEAQLESAKRDAERYNWLKSNARRIDFAGLCVSDGAQLDARIDAARKEQP